MGKSWISSAISFQSIFKGSQFSVWLIFLLNFLKTCLLMFCGNTEYMMHLLYNFIIMGPNLQFELFLMTMYFFGKHLIIKYIDKKCNISSKLSCVQKLPLLTIITLIAPFVVFNYWLFFIFPSPSVQIGYYTTDSIYWNKARNRQAILCEAIKSTGQIKSN